jgi:branched-chain amino acid transport system permease protein
MDPISALVVLTNFVIIPAVAYGSQLALGALGVTLIYGILRFANIAHGDIMAFGTMWTILATWLLQGAGIGPWACCPRRCWRCRWGSWPR